MPSMNWPEVGEEARRGEGEACYPRSSRKRCLVNRRQLLRLVERCNLELED